MKELKIWIERHRRLKEKLESNNKPNRNRKNLEKRNNKTNNTPNKFFYLLKYFEKMK